MVKESNLGGGHCEPRKATKDRWASNVGGGELRLPGGQFYERGIWEPQPQ